MILCTLVRYACAVLVAEQKVRLMIVQCGKSGQVYVCTHVRKMSEMAIIAMQGTVHNTCSNEEHHVLSQNK